jgi:hypothetical protein
MANTCIDLEVRYDLRTSRFNYDLWFEQKSSNPYLLPLALDTHPPKYDIVIVGMVLKLHHS